MKTYTAQSCHEIGYSWQIKAPKGLTHSDIDALQQSLIDFTDDPCQERLEDMLQDTDYCQDLDLTKLDLFKKVIISVETVHRNAFTQDLNQE